MLLVVAQGTIVDAIAQPFEWNTRAVGVRLSATCVVTIEPVVRLVQLATSSAFESFRVLRVILFTDLG